MYNDYYSHDYDRPMCMHALIGMPLMLADPAENDILCSTQKLGSAVNPQR